MVILVKEYKHVFSRSTIGQFEDRLLDFDNMVNKLAKDGWVAKFSNTAALPSELVEMTVYALLEREK
jgi:hypothetical protein